MAGLRYHCQVTSRPHANLELISRVLGSDAVELRIQRLELEENFEDHSSHVVVTATDGGRELIIEGDGVGLVDALWSGFTKYFCAEYESLKTIELAGFTIATDVETKKHTEGTDAIGEVTLEVKNSDGKSFRFKDRSRSIATSSARSVLAAIEYFLNAERAFIKLHSSLQDAKRRNRSDLISRFTGELAEVVKSTSYAAVIEKIKADL